MSAQLEYDIFVIVETWLTSDFFDAEFFDPNQFVVFRKDRDAIKTGRSRGGGVLIAVQRKYNASLIALDNGNTLLDQLCVSVRGSAYSGSLFLIVSYIPPNSLESLYKAHVDNIASLVLNKLGDNHICILGDFNLCDIIWSHSYCTPGLMPTNVSKPFETYF